jgi:hypothetical protein
MKQKKTKVRVPPEPTEPTKEVDLSSNFEMCPYCSSKLNSPNRWGDMLCSSCLHNRDLIELLKKEIVSLKWEKKVAPPIGKTPPLIPMGVALSGEVDGQQIQPGQIVWRDKQGNIVANPFQSYYPNSKLPNED